MTAEDAGVAPEQAAVTAVLADVMAAHPLRQSWQRGAPMGPAGFTVDWCGGCEWAATSSAGTAEHRLHVAAALTASLPADDGARAAIKADTLPQWLAWRFGGKATTADSWDGLSEGDQSYWQHEAEAVRRAVARGGYLDRADSLAADQHADGGQDRG